MIAPESMTDDRLAAMKALWLQPSVSGAQIALAMGRSLRSCQKHAARAGFGPRPRREGVIGRDFLTDERMTVFKALFDEGHSFGEIARRIGSGCTRDMLLGKAHRLGWERTIAVIVPSRKKQTPAAVAARRAAVAPEPHRPKLQIIGTAAVEVAPPRQPRAVPPQDAWAPLPGSTPVHFGDLKFGHCKWPVGEGVEMRCAEPVARGGYCGCHANLAFTAPREPGERAVKELMRSVRRYG